MNIDEEIKRPLSGREMEKIAIKMGLNIKIILYKHLFKYSNINELFNESNNIIILYEWADGFGHWVAFFKNKNYIEFFEPYGTPPDKIKNRIDNVFLKKSGQDIDFIKKLLLNCLFQIFNSAVIQFYQFELKKFEIKPLFLNIYFF